MQISTNVTLEVTPATPTPLATTQWVPMIVSATRDFLERVLIVQVRIFVVRHTIYFLSSWHTLRLDLVHSDVSECSISSHTCHANGTRNNTQDPCDCFCNKEFLRDDVNCLCRNLCSKTRRCFYFTYLIIHISFGSRTCRYQRMSHWESHLSRKRHLQQHTGFL